MIEFVKKAAGKSKYLALAVAGLVSASLVTPVGATGFSVSSGAAALPSGVDSNFGQGINGLLAFIITTFVQSQVIFILLMAVGLYITYRLMKMMLARFRGH